MFLAGGWLHVFPACGLGSGVLTCVCFGFQIKGASLMAQCKEFTCQQIRLGFDPWAGKTAHAMEQLRL